MIEVSRYEIVVKYTTKDGQEGQCSYNSEQQSKLLLQEIRDFKKPASGRGVECLGTTVIIHGVKEHDPVLLVSGETPACGCLS